MKIIQLIKQLNNTELGNGSTHETYVLIPKNLNITAIFEKFGIEYEFKDPFSNEVVKIRNTVDREQRIVGLGQYYRNQSLSAGDFVIFERHINNFENNFFIRTVKLKKAIVFQKFKNEDGFEILTPQYSKVINGCEANLKKTFNITFWKKDKKRSDSPDITDVYKITVNGQSIANNFKAKKMGYLDISGEKPVIKQSYGWKLLEVEDE